MIIPVTLALGPSADAQSFPPALAQIGTSELALIELQGSLEVEGDKIHTPFHFHQCQSKGKPTLFIGYHLFEGKIVNLSKPLAVLHHAVPSSTDADAMDVDYDKRVALSYEIRAIVRKKLVFSQRPMPMVGLAGNPSLAKPASSPGKERARNDGVPAAAFSDHVG